MKILMTIIFVFVFSFAAFGQQKGNVDEKNKNVIQKAKEKITETVKDFFGNEPKKVKIKDYSKKYKNQWLLYFTGISFKYLYNPAKATRKEQIVEIWTQKVDMTDDKVVDLTLYEIDCASSKLRYTATTVYYTYGIQPDGKEGRKITDASYQDNINESFKIVLPNTAQESLVEVACKL